MLKFGQFFLAFCCTAIGIIEMLIQFAILLFFLVEKHDQMLFRLYLFAQLIREHFDFGLLSVDLALEVGDSLC